MYSVTIHNGAETRTIHDYRAAKNAQKLATASIVDAVNSISSFTFTIYPDNVGFDKLNEYTTVVKVRNAKRNRYDFVGRVLQIEPSMDSSGMISKTVVCESRLGYLQDSVQPYAATRYFTGDDTRTGLEEFIDLLLENHNAQVEEHKRIYRGTVTVDPFVSTDNVSKGLNWESTYDCIKSKLLDSFGGYIVLRETGGVLYLDYLQSVGETRSTSIEVGRNMIAATKEIDVSSIITRLIPLGAKLKTTNEDGEESESEERLTIAGINDGKNYIESELYLAKYGIKYGTVIFDEVTEASNLLRKGTEALAANNGLVLNHQVDALELSLIGLAIDDFVLYDRYPVRNSLLAINDTLQIIKKVTNVCEPHNSSFEMGSTKKNLSDTVIDGFNNIQVPSGGSGTAGKDGVGVERIVPYYATGDSKTEAPSTPAIGTWTPKAPEVGVGEYLWIAYYIVYTDGRAEWSTPSCMPTGDQIVQGDTVPSNPHAGALWLDTSKYPYQLKRYDGTDWEIVSDYSSNIQNIYTYVDTAISNAQLTDEQIYAAVEQKTVTKGDYEEFVQNVRNILQMEADGTTMLFQAINDAITQVGDTEATHHAELLTYIRFSDNGIEIGKKDSAITMQLDNDSLDFYHNGTRVAYVSDNMLYITDGRFLNSLRIGAYGFIHETNGSISFTYLGGE